MIKNFRTNSSLSDPTGKRKLVRTGLVFYFDAEDLSGSDAAEVTTLPDRTGLQTFTQGTSTLRGVKKVEVAKGSKNALRMDGTDDVYTSSAAASYWKFLHDGTGSVFHIVAKPTSGTPTGGQELLSTGGFASTNHGISVARIGSSSNLVITIARGVAGQLSASYSGSGVSAVNTAQVITMLFSSARYAVWLDGTKVADAAPSYAPSTSDPTFTAGVGLTSASYPCARDLYSVAIYDEALTDGQIAANIAYLRLRWV